MKKKLNELHNYTILTIEYTRIIYIIYVIYTLYTYNIYYITTVLVLFMYFQREFPVKLSLYKTVMRNREHFTMSKSLTISHKYNAKKDQPRT